MNGITELITIAKYWKRWADPRLVIMVLNNRELAFVTWEERLQAGDPKWPASQDLPYAECGTTVCQTAPLPLRYGNNLESKITWRAVESASETALKNG
ncbi:hypothetical protein [Bosea sp. 2RAB26]|uniref:hypothetical protein n=1 Tax=Bosea sp. 2RAB26 TaxID=3237476 RepID=UPI003F8FB21C